MSRTIMLIPVSTNTGLVSVSLGMIKAIERQGIKLRLFVPIAQYKSSENTLDALAHIIRTHSSIPYVEPLCMNKVEFLLSSHQEETLMEEIIERYHKSTKDAEVVLVIGLSPMRKYQFTITLNYEIACTLNAEIVFIISPGDDTLNQIKKRIELLRSRFFSGNKSKNIIGVIVNKLNAPINKYGYARPELAEMIDSSNKNSISNTDLNLLFKNNSIPVLGCIPWNADLTATRAIDIANRINATIINAGAIQNRRIKSVAFCNYSLPETLDCFHPGYLLVTPSSRHDILIAACLATMNGTEIGAILLTGKYSTDSRIIKLCERALQTGLPIFAVQTDMWQTSFNLQDIYLELSAEDHTRVEKLQNYIANYLDSSWIKSLSVVSTLPKRISPSAFLYQLTELARQAEKRIVLPEGCEPRTIKAASICVKRGIAKCILLGNPEKIKRVAGIQGIGLSKNISIIDPDTVRKNYILRLVELRRDKGMTAIIADKQLEDNVVLGTLMLEQDEVDGLVSGAIHTTANTIRPSLQLIKTAPGSSLVSSVFFMLLPDQVLVYGDCAINTNPTSEQLAEIAIQSADSASAFGIQPRVAMISYSTGYSGTGNDVEKVRKATYLAQKKRPNLIIDGPLQYDAAVVADVALLKAPNSPVAGMATVLIFPDLNTGNTVYKAVQRSANLISIGPMLQGIRKPVNDLSRGALVSDIVYTIALTAVQAKQLSRKN